MRVRVARGGGSLVAGIARTRRAEPSRAEQPVRVLFIVLAIARRRALSERVPRASRLERYRRARASCKRATGRVDSGLHVGIRPRECAPIRIDTYATRLTGGHRRWQSRSVHVRDESKLVRVRLQSCATWPSRTRAPSAASCPTPAPPQRPPRAAPRSPPTATRYLSLSLSLSPPASSLLFCFC